MKTFLPFLIILFFVQNAIGQQFAIDHLEQSPRHHEWISVENDGRSILNFVAFPENRETTLAVIVIHENRGLTDWVRSFADQIAAAGYIAIAPDLLSQFDSDHQRTSDFSSSDAARDALYQLDPDQITNDLHNVREYIASHPASNGTTVVAGFCWGGSQTFRFATNSSDIDAAMVFYGSAPENSNAVQQISAPVYGFYGEKDQRINSGIPAIEELMNQFNRVYEYEIYAGAGHAYMRAGDDPEGSEANKAARDTSWERLNDILDQIDN